MTPTTLEPLGFTASGEIAFRWTLPDGTTTEEITLSESDLDTLTAEYRRDTLPLWPVQPCAECGTDAAQLIEDRPLCHGHAMGFAEAEDWSQEGLR